MSPAATARLRSAAVTRRTAALACCRADATDGALTCTPMPSVSWFGVPVTAPVPVTVILADPGEAVSSAAAAVPAMAERTTGDRALAMAETPDPAVTVLPLGRSAAVSGSGVGTAAPASPPAGAARHGLLPGAAYCRAAPPWPVVAAWPVLSPWPVGVAGCGAAGAGSGSVTRCGAIASVSADRCSGV